MSEQKQNDPSGSPTTVRPEDIAFSPQPEHPVMPKQLNPPGGGWAEYMKHIKPQGGLT
jgi:hypothetical protein